MRFQISNNSEQHLDFLRSTLLPTKATFHQTHPQAISKETLIVTSVRTLTTSYREPILRGPYRRYELSAIVEMIGDGKCRHHLLGSQSFNPFQSMPFEASQPISIRVNGSYGNEFDGKRNVCYIKDNCEKGLLLLDIDLEELVMVTLHEPLPCISIGRKEDPNKFRTYEDWVIF